MRRPRITIATLMVLVALLAIDGVVMRAGFSASDRVSQQVLFVFDQSRIDGLVVALALGGVPMASLLGLGSVALLRDLARRGGCSPFLLGFVVGGSAGLTAYVACSVLAPEWTNRYVEAGCILLLYLPDLILRGVEGMISEDMSWAVYFATVILVLVLPQMLLAFLGGVLNERKLRIVLMVQPVAAVDSEAPPAAP